MNINRKLIIDTIFIDKTLRHPALQLKWYKKHNIENIYNLIFLETQFLDNYIDVSLRERIFYIQKDYTEVQLCKFCSNKVYYRNSKISLTAVCKNKECHSKLRSEILNKTWKELYTINIDKLHERNKKISLNKLGKSPSCYK